MTSPMDLPPAIAFGKKVDSESERSFKLTLADGAHRFGALKRMGENSMWLVIWWNSEADLEQFKAEYANSAYR